MTEARIELGTETAAGYLRGVNRLPPGIDPSITRLGGGVSNTVLSVAWDGNCLVLKQPLPNLAVEDDWPADVGRVHNEAAAVRAYIRLLRDAEFEAVTVPAVRFEDERHHVIGLECAPHRATMWKSELLDGRIDRTIATALGTALGVVHNRAADDPSLETEFDDPRAFDQLRLDPYHRTVAERHPELAEPVLAEAERIAAVNRTLVHGDYSPKNVLVDRAGAEPINWLIDFEVAHWGDPAFDVAFMLNHLTIKALYIVDRRESLLKAIHDFWEAYRERTHWDIESAVVAELGVLILARIDGKSPVEYVEEGPVAKAMRRVGSRALDESVECLDSYAELILSEGP